MAQTYPGKTPERPLLRLRPTRLALSARIGMPEEVANTAPSQGNDEVRFISAADILIDGVQPQLHHQ